MWTLLIILMYGSFNTQIKLEQIPMMDRAACVTAADHFLKNTKGVGVMCISSNTGEVIEFKKD